MGARSVEARGLRHGRRRDAGGGCQDNDRGEPDGPRVLKLGIQRQPFLRSHGAAGRCRKGRREGTGPGRSVVVEDRVIRNVEMRQVIGRSFLRAVNAVYPWGSSKQSRGSKRYTSYCHRSSTTFRTGLETPLSRSRRPAHSRAHSGRCLLRAGWRTAAARAAKAVAGCSTGRLQPSCPSRARKFAGSAGSLAVSRPRAAFPAAGREFADDVSPSKLHREVEATAGPTVPGAWYLAPYVAPSLGTATQSKADIHDSAYSPRSETWAIGQVTSRGSHKTRRGGGQQASTVDPQAGQGGPPTAGVTLSACRQTEVDSSWKRS